MYLGMVSGGVTNTKDLNVTAETSNGTVTATTTLTGRTSP
jgi:hypothetical protein